MAMVEETQKAGGVAEALSVMVLLQMEQMRLKEKLLPMDLLEVQATAEMPMEVLAVALVVMGRIINPVVEEVDTPVAAEVPKIMVVVVVHLFHPVKIPIFLKTPMKGTVK